MSVFSRLTTTELRVCCLVKANVPPVTIAMLIVTTPTNVSMIRKRLYEKVYPQEKGSLKSLIGSLESIYSSCHILCNMDD